MNQGKHDFADDSSETTSGYLQLPWMENESQPSTSYFGDPSLNYFSAPNVPLYQRTNHPDNAISPESMNSTLARSNSFGYGGWSSSTTLTTTVSLVSPSTGPRIAAGYSGSNVISPTSLTDDTSPYWMSADNSGSQSQEEANAYYHTPSPHDRVVASSEGDTAQADPSPKRRKKQQTVEASGSKSSSKCGNPSPPSKGNSKKPLSTTRASSSRAPPSTPVPTLRTASRKAKRNSTAYMPATSPAKQRARNSHNQVEKEYRNRLNAKFERLLAMLPVPEEGGEDGQDDCKPFVDSQKRLSKAEVLDIARHHIRTLEKETLSLEQEKQRLVESIERMTDSVFKGAAAVDL